MSFVMGVFIPDCARERAGGVRVGVWVWVGVWVGE